MKIIFFLLEFWDILQAKQLIENKIDKVINGRNKHELQAYCKDTYWYAPCVKVHGKIVSFIASSSGQSHRGQQK